MYASIHVRFVIVAHINHIVAPLHSAGQGLKPDVISTAVAAEGDKFKIFLHLTPLLQGLVCRFYAGQGSRRVFKSGMNIAVFISGVWIHKGGNLQAAGGVCYYCLVFRFQRPQDAPHSDSRSAARAEPVAACQPFFLFYFFL